MPLTPEEARSHGDQYVRGWRLRRRYPEAEVALHLLLDQDFPYSLPRVALADLPPPLTWPHVEANGMLCLAPSGTTVSTERPDDAVRVLRDSVLKDAIDLVGSLLAGGLEDHFLDEFHAYWTKGERGNGRALLSLLTLTPSSRQVAVFREKESYLVGDSPEACETWLRHFHGTVNETYTTEPAAYIWLRRPPYPREYPLRRGTLGTVLKDLSPDGFGVLTTLLRDEPSSLVIVLASEWKGQRELGGLLLVKPKPSSGYRGYDTDVLRPGFRPGKIPPSLLAARYIGSANAPLRSDVERVDYRWINGKDRNTWVELLTSKRVCILGCGSLGAGVARLLAQSGVGTLHLVDHDSLDWPNTSRHVLGAQEVDQFKAPALARTLGRDFPHLADVQSHRLRWQHLPSREEFLAGFDLLIAVTGDWNSDAALSDIQHNHATFPPVLFG
jgi:sulfur-carrier protein adenylyltransferase/sulfurtransferase